MKKGGRKEGWRHCIKTAGNDIELFAALFCTNLTYTISAVISNYSNSDILDGTVSVMTISYFCGLGETLSRDIQCTSVWQHA